MDYQALIDKYYPEGTEGRRIFMLHSRQVADKALAIAHRCSLPLDDKLITEAAMLHDIGIFMTDAPGIGCHGKEHYLRHGILGAQLLRQEGFAEEVARVAERHTGAGLTAREIVDNGLPLPHRDFLPETLLERLVCYADKFYSKSGDMQEKSFDKARAQMARFGAASLARFDAMAQEFGR